MGIIPRMAKFTNGSPMKMALAVRDQKFEPIAPNTKQDTNPVVIAATVPVEMNFFQ